MTSISRVKDIIPRMRQAFQMACDGVPGPVFVEFPLDTIWPLHSIEEQSGLKQAPKLTWSKASVSQWMEHHYVSHHLSKVFKDGFEPIPSAPPAASTTLTTLYDVPKWGMGHLKQLSTTGVERVQQLLLQSKRPVIVLGSQAVRPQTCEQLAQALERLQCPVYLSGMARGLLVRI